MFRKVRQAVMCWADMGVLMKYFDPRPGNDHEDRLLFDMGTYHNCRDFERIKEWTEENAVEGLKMDNLWLGGSHDV
jgi:hypothetical protein